MNNKVVAIETLDFKKYNYDKSLEGISLDLLRSLKGLSYVGVPALLYILPLLSILKFNVDEDKASGLGILYTIGFMFSFFKLMTSLELVVQKADVVLEKKQKERKLLVELNENVKTILSLPKSFQRTQSIKSILSDIDKKSSFIKLTDFLKFVDLINNENIKSDKELAIVFADFLVANSFSSRQVRSGSHKEENGSYGVAGGGSYGITSTANKAEIDSGTTEWRGDGTYREVDDFETEYFVKDEVALLKTLQEKLYFTEAEAKEMVAKVKASKGIK